MRIISLPYNCSDHKAWSCLLYTSSEAVILPLCPDKGSCMEYDENLAASVYLENDLEMLGRMKKFMV